MTIEKTLARPYRKLYAPQGMDRWDPTVIRGRSIKPGTVVTVTAHVGPFRWITDMVNAMSVGRASLIPVPRNLDQLKAKADEQAKIHRTWFVVAAYDDGVAQVLRKDDSDAALAVHPGLFYVVHEAVPFSVPTARRTQ